MNNFNEGEWTQEPAKVAGFYWIQDPYYEPTSKKHVYQLIKWVPKGFTSGDCRWSVPVPKPPIFPPN